MSHRCRSSGVLWYDGISTEGYQLVWTGSGSYHGKLGTGIGKEIFRDSLSFTVILVNFYQIEEKISCKNVQKS